MLMKSLSWYLAFAGLAFQAINVQGNESCVAEKDFVTMNRRLANSDSSFDTTDEFEYEINNGHKMTVTGFDSTRAIAHGFRCFSGCSLGDGLNGQAKAVVSDLVPGETYRFRIWQFSQPEEFKGGQFRNELFVNGVKYETTMGDFSSAYGYIQANTDGEINIIFVQTDTITMGFTQINVARVCGCSFDKECPGGELCEGSPSDLKSGDGVCTIGVKNVMCAETDFRGAGTTCRYWTGSGVYAGEAFCTAFPSETRPDFDPMNMCCACSGGLTWVKTDYLHDNSGYYWRKFPKVTAKDQFGDVVLDIGERTKIAGVMIDPAPGRKTPKQITASSGKSDTGPWEKLAEWDLDKYERTWTDFDSNKRFIRLSWNETFNKNKSKLSEIGVKIAHSAPDVSEPEGGWTGKFSLVKDSNVEPNPKCVVSDGCVTSPNWPDSYSDEGCEIMIDEDTVLVATNFEVATQQGGISDDYLILNSSVRGSSGLFTNSAGPYYVHVKAGDRLIWSTDDWEYASGFRICGYTPGDDEELPMWPQSCDGFNKKSNCNKAGCQWNNQKEECKTKPMCSKYGKKKQCKRNKGICTWNKNELACQAKLYGFQ